MKGLRFNWFSRHYSVMQAQSSPAARLVCPARDSQSNLHRLVQWSALPGESSHSLVMMPSLLLSLVLLPGIQCQEAIVLPVSQDPQCLPGWDCQAARDCSVALARFRDTGERPQVCGFMGREPLVCCRSECGRKGSRRVAREVEVGVPQAVSHTPPVVGGQDVSWASIYPWVAALGASQPDGQIVWFCAGSLVANKWLLTAAHCLKDLEYNLDVIRLGAHDLSNPHETSFDYQPLKVTLDAKHIVSTFA